MTNLLKSILFNLEKKFRMICLINGVETEKKKSNYGAHLKIFPKMVFMLLSYFNFTLESSKFIENCDFTYDVP